MAWPTWLCLMPCPSSQGQTGEVLVFEEGVFAFEGGGGCGGCPVLECPARQAKARRVRCLLGGGGLCFLRLLACVGGIM